MNIPSRQVHLDFHTSEHIKDIGKEFDAKDFADKLVNAGVNSITLFAKCHHGNFYYFSKQFNIHPHLSIDLLSEQVAACKEAGINTPIYISAGLDEYSAERHPEWLSRNITGGTQGNEKYLQPGFRLLCFNTPYLDLLLKQVEEVVLKFMPSGLFFDICLEWNCYCSNCLRDMKSKGLDYKNPEHAKRQAKDVLSNYYRRIDEAVRKIKPDISIFHNGGNFPRGRRDLWEYNTHLEIESLPTGQWGYDHFPLSISYVRQSGKSCLGMTGKFHTSWGEFGGFKYKDALLYEASQCLAFGAGISIGDQLHPNGMLDNLTYDNIKYAYDYVKQIEDLCLNVTSVADIGLLSQDIILENFNQKGDTGANRMLLEGKYLFDLIDSESDFFKYKLLILPDSITIDDILFEKLKEFCEKGGKLLVSGESGLDKAKQNFRFDFGAKYISEDKFNPTYGRLNIDAADIKGAIVVLYGKSYKVTAKNILADKFYPYFNREGEMFCSHQHAPADLEGEITPGITEGSNGIYIAWKIFEEYFNYGTMSSKEIVKALIDRLLNDSKTLNTNLPSQARITLMKRGSIYINHLLFANKIKKGVGIEVIEDLIPLHDVNISLKLPEKIKNIYTMPQHDVVKFTQKDGVVKYSIAKFRCHQIIVLET